MAQVKKYTYGQSSWSGDAAEGKAFFDSLNCPLITASALVDAQTFSITIDDVMTIRFDAGTSNSYHAIKLVYGGSETTIGDIRTYESKTFVVVFTDDFIYINKTATNTAEFGFIYEKINDKTYYGSATSTVKFEEIVMTCIEDELTYYHSIRLNYENDIGSIDYAPSVLFLSDAKTDIEDSNLVACSKVTAKKVLTFGGNNYYSVGTNTLVSMD